MSTRQSSSQTRTTADNRAKTIAAVERFYRPGKADPLIVSRKQKFEKVLGIAADFCAWVTSVPGAAEIRFECLPESPLPDELRQLGYRVVEAGNGERIIAHTIVERFTRTSSGALELLTPGSTAPVAEVRSHAGIVPVLKYEVI